MYACMYVFMSVRIRVRVHMHVCACVYVYACEYTCFEVTPTYLLRVGRALRPWMAGFGLPRPIKRSWMAQEESML